MKHREFAERFRLAVEHAGVPKSQKALGQLLGVSGPMVSGYRTGEKMPSMATAARMADRFGVNVDWLLTGRGPMLPTDREEPEAEQDMERSPHASDALGHAYNPGEYIFIPLLEAESVSLAAGNGRVVAHEVVGQDLAFLASWLRKKQINPAASRVVTIRGDSMAPYLMDDDVVLIDTSDTAISNYKVYAIEIGGETRIKRLYRRPDGTIIMHSDNPSWTPREEPITPGELENGLVRIIGRMRWRGGEGDT